MNNDGRKNHIPIKDNQVAGKKTLDSLLILNAAAALLRGGWLKKMIKGKAELHRDTDRSTAAQKEKEDWKGRKI